MPSKNSLFSLTRSLILAGTAVSIMAACSGGNPSQAPLPPTAGGDLPTMNGKSKAPSNGVSTLSTTTAPQFGVVQTAKAGATYNSTVTVHLSKAPVAGNVLVLFFEQNKTATFPYSGQVAWPSTASGSAWSYDGGTSSTAILHHTVVAGETGSYTLNVGGAGSGWADYMVAEVSGENPTNPVNNRLGHSVSAGVTQFNFGSGITPKSAGTYPVAFFSAHAAGGRTWGAISSGWTKVATNSDYTEMIAVGPVQTGTSVVSATATLSSSSSYTGSADVVLLNPKTSTTTSTPAPTSSATPVPTASATPVPVATNAPTPVPAGTSSYTYHGCRVFTANDWFTTNLVSGGSSYVPNTVDPNSANIVNNLHSAFGTVDFSKNTEAISETANVDNEASPWYMKTVSTYSGGAGFANDPYNDDPAPFSVPVTTGAFYQEGTRGCTTSSGDCHVVVVDNVKCLDYETYTFDRVSWNGSTFTAGGGGVENLNHPYQIERVAVSGANLPMMGTTDWGEDLSYQQTACQPNCAIPHVVAFLLPKQAVATGGYVSPADGAQAACSSYCSYKLPYGARLRLHSSYPCPSPTTNPQANLVCNQLKQYGMIYNDLVGIDGWGGIRLGTSSNGTNPWNSSDYNALLAKVQITDFDVMTLGTVH